MERRHVRRCLKQALLILLSIGVAACSSVHTTMRVVAEGPDAARLAATGTVHVVVEGRDAVQVVSDGKDPVVRSGKRLLVITNKGERISIRIIVVEREAILGTIDGRAEPVRIPYEQIARLDYEEVSVTKIVSLAVAIALAVIAVLIHWG